ncbi:hypothetical protein TNCV_3362281 [Trichonephila clavipes]|nr:hypothetical protein TNCV_3362281 [Trichonephila clavipes]
MALSGSLPQINLGVQGLSEKEKALGLAFERINRTNGLDKPDISSSNNFSPRREKYMPKETKILDDAISSIILENYTTANQLMFDTKAYIELKVAINGIITVKDGVVKDS